MGPIAEEARLRVVEGKIVNLETRASTWDANDNRVRVLETGLGNVWAEIGKIKVKAGVVWALVAGVAGVAASVVSTLLIHSMTK